MNHNFIALQLHQLKYIALLEHSSNYFLSPTTPPATTTFSCSSPAPYLHPSKPRWVLILPPHQEFNHTYTYKYSTLNQNSFFIATATSTFLRVHSPQTHEIHNDHMSIYRRPALIQSSFLYTFSSYLLSSFTRKHYDYNKNFKTHNMFINYKIYVLIHISFWFYY